MKKTIKTLVIAVFAISLALTSCSKDETTKAVSSTPTVEVTDSTGTGKIDTTNFFVHSFMKIKATPASGTTVDSMKFEIKINGMLFPGSAFDAINSNQKAGFSETLPVDEIVAEIGLPFGATIAFIVTIKDSKGQTATSEATYNITQDKGIISSGEIELGAQTNTTIPYNFLGLANSFATYTAGLSGTANKNSGNIDFVYYFGDNDKNAFAAPSNADGAKKIWGLEINTWARQNQTKFKTTTLTSAEFDNIKNSSKIETDFANIDFATGTTEKVTTLAVGSVIAFKTALGVKGLAKFTAISADATGSTKVVIICQN